MPPKDAVDWNLWWGGCHALSHGSNRSAGVAVLFTITTNATIISSSDVVKGWLLIVKAEIESTLFSFHEHTCPQSRFRESQSFILLKNELKNYQDQLIEHHVHQTDR